MQVVMHSYTFREYTLEHALRAAKRFGWDGMELQPCHIDLSNIGPELDRCVALADTFGVPVKCVDFVGDYVNDDPKIIEVAIDNLKKQIDECAKHGIALINGCAAGLTGDNPMDFGANGSAIATDTHYERAAEAFKEAGAYAASKGVRIVFEIHMNTIHDTIASTVKLLDMIACDNVMANPDPGNMFATSTAEKDVEALDMLKGRLGYFHFKNTRNTGPGQYDYSTRLAEGHIDLNKYIEKLVSMGYDETVCIEYCGVGDPNVSAEQDIRFVRDRIAWALEI